MGAQHILMRMSACECVCAAYVSETAISTVNALLIVINMQALCLLFLGRIIAGRALVERVTHDLL